MQKEIDKILSTIQSAIDDFQGNIPALQKIIFEQLQPLLKELAVRNGMLLNNLQNLRAIGEIRNKLERLIISNEYKTSVKAFLAAFEQVSKFQIEYFKQFNIKYNPSKTLPIIRELAIDSTVNGLLGQGMQDSLIRPVTSILTNNITTGGSYASFANQLKEHFESTPGSEGALQKYTKQITTDSINQYSAQVNATIGQDLKFNWLRYVGSTLTTSREFCIWLRKKEWVHKSELPAIIRGQIDGHNCKLSATTGLPVGMIPGTDAANFGVLRGGYKCGDGAYWVPDSVVPAEVKSRIT